MSRLRAALPRDNSHAWHPEPLGPSHRDGLSVNDARRVYDVCVVGSGAGGSVAADHLVRAGLNVLLVEEGFRLAPGVTNGQLDKLCRRAEIRGDDGTWIERGWPWTTSNLGGGTVFYGAASFRYHDFDFDPAELIHVRGLDVSWPYALADLAPYYTEIEHRLGVSGGDDTETEHGRGPAHPRSAAGRRLWAAGEELGYRPFPTPLAINRDDRDDRPGCSAASLCISFQCPTRAKSDAVSVFLRPLAGHPGLALRTGVRAIALDQRAPGRVDELIVLDRLTRRVHRVRARTFVLACNAIQTAALLLRSRGRYAPGGVGNESDMVGRGLCMKLSEYVAGSVDPLDPGAGGRPLPGPFSTVSFTDHYLDEECPTGVGGLLYEAKPDEPDATGADSVLRVETILADHPSPENRVALGDQRDEDGVPVIRMHYRPDPRDLARLSHMVERGRRLLRQCGARDIRTEPGDFIEGSTHLHGTCRAGTDPATSVTDPWGRVHSTDNVYVADGSVMPYPGGLSPTLTIQAHSLRTAAAIARRAKTSTVA